MTVLENYPDLDVVVPVLASALQEARLRGRALGFLLASPSTRAPREIVRGFHRLDRSERRAALDGTPVRLLDAARQLLRSERTRTRANVASVARLLLEGDRARIPAVLPLLLLLFDDPQAQVADEARQTFMTAILAGADPTPVGPRDPIFQGLVLLLERYPSHGDADVIRALFAIGPHGADLLARAVGEGWAASTAAILIADEKIDDEAIMAARVSGIFRWLDSPFLPAREAARELLRERIDTPFLRAAARRLESPDPELRAREYPVYRRMHWDELPAEDLSRFHPETLLRMAGYLALSGDPPAERARRVAALLPAVAGAARQELLRRLKELPNDELLAALAPVLDDPSLENQLLATDMLPLRGERRGYLLMIRQLRSPFGEVRELAQRRLGGRSLALYLGAFDTLGHAERGAMLELLRKIDPTFLPQLRRALRATEEETVILALRAVREIDDAAELEDGLLDLTVTPNPRIRATLTRALRRVAPEPRLHYLRLFLGDADARVVANAAETLGELRDARALPWLEALAAHASARVRANALVARVRSGDPLARAALERVGASAPEGSAEAASAAWALAQLAESTGGTDGSR